jgi:hypothetical protein
MSGDTGDNSDDLFARVLGPGWGLGNRAHEQGPSEETSVQLRFTVRWDVDEKCWMAAATELPQDRGPLMNSRSDTSPADAAAKLWEEMARRIRERISE